MTEQEICKVRQLALTLDIECVLRELDAGARYENVESELWYLVEELGDVNEYLSTIN